MKPESLPLRDIHLPAAIGAWPPALGWWLLALLLLGLGGLSVWYWRKWRQKRAEDVPLIALQAVDKLQRLHRNNSQALLCELSVLLRRIAISLHGREPVAGLTGAAWLGFLDKKAGKILFSKSLGILLTEHPYRADVQAGSAELAALVEAVRTWIKSQQRGKGHV